MGYLLFHLRYRPLSMIHETNSRACDCGESRSSLAGAGVVWDNIPLMNAVSRPQWAITLVETLVVGIVLAVGLWLLSGLYDRYLDQARSRQGAAVIRSLDLALGAYYQTCAAWPPGEYDGSAGTALAALAGVPASAEHLEALPVRLLYAADDGRIACRDPWGRRLHYLTALIADTDGKRRVEHNGGRPIFESAGPDGRFGQSTNPATADDIRSDEPG